jgi:ribonuclease E
MTKRMLIDASHAEETRVVVLDGNRLEDFDVETSGKKQLKGNIYLAKVVRVEPSLQAAFVEYGGNRHGFLAFGEIHPDYYQIPVADRQRLIALQAEAARAEQAAEEAADAAAERAAREPSRPPHQTSVTPEAETAPELSTSEDAPAMEPPEFDASQQPPPELNSLEFGSTEPSFVVALDPPPSAEAIEDSAQPSVSDAAPEDPQDQPATSIPEPQIAAGDAQIETVAAEAPPDMVGGETDSGEDGRERRVPMQYLRNYKIQEVIRRRQILLVQVVKEERGTKGAALTTYISLAGRFCVLMPNSPRGGGISRKITSAADRRRLKEITAELEIPDGMGMIVRTAGANRPKPEIKRDCEYLLRLWDEVRELTLRSVAPALIHEEASLIKRAIRDVYSRDIEEILVDGEEGWRAARDFMRMLMPAHAQKVIAWRDLTQPLFAKHAVEAQLDAMMGRNVQLRSGGYLVIDQTEALVSIDVNSGRSTRERGIEETALRTNLEAADEVARQLRLRDLAGLIVIDFIDMESKKHNAMVERRLQEALKVDRARIQVGHISHFGLMEMSRQRLRPSLMEASLVPCPHCSGSGHVRSTESAAIHVLRGIEDEGARRRNAEIMVHVAPAIAMYILNHKRERLRMIEGRYALRVLLNGDAALIPPQVRVEKLRALEPNEVAELAIAPPATRNDVPAPLPNGSVAHSATDNGYLTPDAQQAADDLLVEDVPDLIDPVPLLAPVPAPANASVNLAAEETAESRAEEENRRRRRRRRRGPRRDDGTDGLSPVAALGAEQPDLVPLVPETLPMPAPGPVLVEAPLSETAHLATPAPALEELGSEKSAPIAEAPEALAPATVAPEPHVAEPVISEPTVSIEPIEEMGTAESSTLALSGGEDLPAPEALNAPAPEALNAPAPEALNAPAPEALNAPAPEALSTEEDSELKTRRRGRRGGRRRRRDEDEPAVALVAAPEPDLPLAYTGPTPADPFGQQPFDIFDVMEQVEQARAAAAPPPKAAAEPLASEIPAPATPPEPDPQPEPQPVMVASEIPRSNGLHLVEIPAAPETAPPEEMHVAPEPPPPGPLVQPVLINAPAAERKRGWWRR